MVPHSRIFEKEFNGTLSKDNKHKLIKVLRLKEGAEFFITDGKGNEAKAILAQNNNYVAEPIYQPNREPSKNITLFAALTKGSRLEWVIEKATEMGVTKVIPLISERCIQKSPSDSKLERWQKIAISAMMQCGGCQLPIIEKPVKLINLQKPDKGVSAYILHEKSNSKFFSELDSASNKVWLATGPEGGFTENEIAHLVSKEWQSVWLGKRLFRADTAPIVALANLLSTCWY